MDDKYNSLSFHGTLAATPVNQPLHFREPARWRCPKCERVSADCLSIDLGVPADSNYCLFCCTEWVAAHVPKLEPIQEAKE